jgi:Fe-S-cluster containining protein
VHWHQQPTAGFKSTKQGSMHTLSLDGKNGVLFINGTCQEAVPTCQALCCRRWEIPLTQAEYESGLYQAQALCRVDSQECIGTHAQCPQRLFRLKLKPDNSCWHLTGESLCSIYEKRPAVCRAFSCAGGWTLGHVRQVQEKNQESLPAELVKKGWENFHSSMVFKRSAENLLKTGCQAHRGVPHNHLAFFPGRPEHIRLLF